MQTVSKDKTVFESSEPSSRGITVVETLTKLSKALSCSQTSPPSPPPPPPTGARPGLWRNNIFLQ